MIIFLYDIIKDIAGSANILISNAGEAKDRDFA